MAPHVRPQQQQQQQQQGCQENGSAKTGGACSTCTAARVHVDSLEHELAVALMRQQMREQLVLELERQLADLQQEIKLLQSAAPLPPPPRPLSMESTLSDATVIDCRPLQSIREQPDSAGDDDSNASSSSSSSSSGNSSACSAISTSGVESAGHETVQLEMQNEQLLRQWALALDHVDRVQERLADEVREREVLREQLAGAVARERRNLLLVLAVGFLLVALVLCSGGGAQ